MDLDQFWGIVEGVESPADLHSRLDALGQKDLIAFEQQHKARENEAYDWGIWGAAYVIHGGCSDDAFDYFRAYLISRGRAAFEAALADADSLADCDLDEEGEEWEDWMSPTMMVIHARTGEYRYADPNPASAHAAEPTGEDWREDDLPARFPRLTARYG